MNPAASIATVPMSEADYDAERAKIGKDKCEATIRWEQALALLFYRSGWTQEKLAAKEGKSQAWVSYRLVFGRFLAFSENITTVINLTERQFRKYWRESARAEINERARFIEVRRQLEVYSSSTADNKIDAPVRGLGTKIREAFSDGKFHALETIAAKVGASEAHVKTALSGLRIKESDQRKVGASTQYRIFPTDRMISLEELTTKLRPLVNDLIIEGKKNSATMSPGTVADRAHQMKVLLDEWCR